MRFPPQFLDEIRNRISVSQVVGRFVALKQKGKGQFTGLCPFHSEKTASFSVSDTKGFYHCFGCGAHGDVVRFLTENRGLHFVDAVKELASQAGLEVPKYTKEDEERYKKIDDIYQVLELACGFFEQNLLTQKGAEALGYFKSRGLKDEIIKQFRLGYSLDNSKALKEFLLSKNVDENLMISAGLLGRDDKGETYDRFRDRVIFPIFDNKGRPIAFGGRILSDRKDIAKYLNSPETDLFKKGYTLYAYNFARDTAYDKGAIAVVEGYMDVIALHQAGIKNVVAPLGTAITENHIKMLWKICKEPVLCLDGDKAGLRAMRRVAEEFVTHLEPGNTIKFAIIPGGKDPDDFIKEQGVAAMRKTLGSAENLVDVLWNSYDAEADVTTPEKRAQFEQELLGLTKKILNPEVKKYYEQEFRNRLREKFSNKTNWNKVKFKTNKVKAAKDMKVSSKERLEALLLLSMVANPVAFKKHKLLEEISNLHFSNNILEILLIKTIDIIENVEDFDLNSEILANHLKEAELSDKIEYLQNYSNKDEFIRPGAEEIVVISGAKFIMSSLRLEVLNDEYNNLIHTNEEAAFEFLNEIAKEKTNNKNLKENYEQLLE
jgi:DNA primase